MRFTLNLLCCLVLTGCATYGDSALQPGQSTTTRIEQRLGPLVGSGGAWLRLQ